MFFITFNGRLLVNLIDKSKFDIRVLVFAKLSTYFRKSPRTSLSFSSPKLKFNSYFS